MDKDEVRIIYKETYTKKTKNTTKDKPTNKIKDYLHKEGIWALYGKKDDFFYCLNVGKCDNVGSEILMDISCLHNLDYKDLIAEKREGLSEENQKTYINQFGEDCKFNYICGLTQEYLYSYIRQENYESLIFIYVYNESDGDNEEMFAWLTHAKFWRNGHPFYKVKSDDYYTNGLSDIKLNGIILEDKWENEEQIIEYIEEIIKNIEKIKWKE